MSIEKEAKPEKVTVRTIRQCKQKSIPITMLTAYDYLTARMVDEAGMDVILVGDSLGMVVLGYEDTLAVTMEDMLHHCRAVARGARRALLVGDMPFLSYQVSVQEAVRNAGLFLKEGNMDAVKLEGGQERLEAIRAIVSTGIPVMGHIGLTPQSINQFGGFFVQGKTAEEGKRLLEDALCLEEAGCFSIVLESIPASVATYISNALRIPTIGIGAGVGCGGQVLVTQDMFGLYDQFTPKFVKKYVDLRMMMLDGLNTYREEVIHANFPSDEYSFHMSEQEWQRFLDLVKGSQS